jgi:alkylation response protein AidB-like acyl-CoA dehydrogenase
VQLELSQEQELFAGTTRRFLENSCPLAVVRQLADEEAGFDPDWWRQAAELGWTSTLVPEALGGGSVSGDGLMDLVLVAHEMGRLVSPGPFLPTNVVASAIATSGTADQQRELLPALMAGDSVATWGFAEPAQGWRAAGVHLSAVPTADGFVLTGTKSPVEAGREADHFLVTARSGEGLTQFVVPAATGGVTVTPLESLDLVRRFATVEFDRAEVAAAAVVGQVGGAGADVERQIQMALTLQCAETVGAGDRVFEFTTQYAFDRYSFGRPLASYQALKHRFADMKMWLEACHATATAAAQAVNSGADNAAEMVSVAKSYIGDHATEIIQDCVQMHGGIGVTWDHDIHLYLRRATVNQVLYGTPQEHRERIATLIGM